MLHLVVRHPSGVQREGQEGYVLQPLPRQFWNNNITRIPATRGCVHQRGDNRELSLGAS